MKRNVLNHVLFEGGNTMQVGIVLERADGTNLDYAIIDETGIDRNYVQGIEIVESPDWPHVEVIITPDDLPSEFVKIRLM